MRFITITAEDIKKGEWREPSWCPVALSLRREFPEFWPIVGQNRVTLVRRGSKESVKFLQTPMLTRFIKQYDSFRPDEWEPPTVEPGFFLFDDEPTNDDSV